MDPTSFFLGVSFGLVMYKGARVARGAARNIGNEILRKVRETKVEVDVNVRLKEQPTEVKQIGRGEPPGT